MSLSPNPSTYSRVASSWNSKLRGAPQVQQGGTELHWEVDTGHSGSVSCLAYRRICSGSRAMRSLNLVNVGSSSVPYSLDRLSASLSDMLYESLELFIFSNSSSLIFTLSFSFSLSMIISNSLKSTELFDKYSGVMDADLQLSEQCFLCSGHSNFWCSLLQ